MNIKKIVFIALGCVCLGLGTVGVFLPILPTTPFYLLTVFFFANSSQKLHDWFLSTKLYQKHLDSFVKKRGMLRSTKISVICTVTLLMGFGIFMMARKGIWIPCVWYHTGGRVMHDATDQLDGAERRKSFRFLRSLPNEYSLTVNGTDCTRRADRE